MTNAVNFGAAVKYPTLSPEQLKKISDKYASIVRLREAENTTTAISGDLFTTNDNRHATILEAVGELQNESVLPKEVVFNILA